MAMTWYDAFGRTVDLNALKTEQAAPTLGSLRRRDNRHPAAGLTPVRLANLLRESIVGDPENYLALAEDMEERDNHYLGVLSIRKMQVAGLELTVEPAGDDAASVEHADLVREVFARPGFYDEAIDILDAVGKGFSCTEIIWETSEREWRPKRLAHRDPRWFRFDPVDSETPLLRNPAGDQPLNPFQWIYHTGKAKTGIPIRGGLARAAAWTYLFKSFTLKDWAIFVEAYGQPLRLGKYDPGASEADKEKLLDAVMNIGADYAAIVPVGMVVEFIKADITGSHELYEKRADWLDRQTSKVVLGQTATTDAIAGGHAVGKTHDRVRDDIEKSDARRFADTLTRDVAKPVVDLNRGPQKKYPRVHIGRPEEIDVAALVKNVTQLVPLGLPVGKKAMLVKIGMPEPDEDDELLVAPRQSTPPGPDDPEEEPKKVEPPALAARRSAGKRDAIDDAVDDMMDDWRPLVGPLVAGLSAQIAEAKSLEDVQKLLLDRFAGLDATALTEQLARAAYAARISGEADEKLI